MTDTRCWRYRAAANDLGYEKRIFDHPDQAPEGWLDTPASFIEKPAPKSAPTPISAPAPAPVAAIPASRPPLPRPPKLPPKKA